MQDYLPTAMMAGAPFAGNLNPAGAIINLGPIRRRKEKPVADGYQIGTNTADRRPVWEAASWGA
jgi:hypothetical protein